MKSLFKRTIAAASSSVLVLSQLATLAANVNVSAADAAPLNIDKKFVLDVPVDEKDPLKAGQFSEWNDKAEAVFTALGTKTVTASTVKAKNAARKAANKAAAKYGHISSAEIDEILGGIADTASVELDGEGGFKATATCANVGPTIGKMAEDELAKRGYPAKNGDGKDVVIDWSGFKASGSIVVTGKVDYDAKTVSYETTLIDENGKSYKGAQGIQDYATKKAAEAYQLVLSQRESNSEKTTKKLADCQKYLADKISALRAFADAFTSIEVSGTDPDTVYTDYVAAAEAVVKSNVPAQYAAKADELIAKANEKAPETIEAALTNEKVNEFYDAAVAFANEAMAGQATISLGTADAVAILNEGYDFDIAIKKGPSASITFKIADDQADELLAAVKAVAGEDATEYAKAKKAAGYVVELEDGSVPTFSDEYTYQIKSVESEKKVTASADTEYGVSGTIGYDVERIIKKIVLTYTKKTTSATTTTTTSDSTSTSTTTSTNPGSGSTTTTTSDTTGETTTTTPATSVSFEIKGINDTGLVYWSEETGTFDLSALSITLHFFEKGAEVGTAVDVTNAFKPDATSPKDLKLGDGIGVSAIPVNFVLQDVLTVQKAVKEAGYGQDLIDQEQIYQGKLAGRFTVILVLRGDSDLNGEVSVEDAQYALIYYTETMVTLKTAKTVLTDENGTYLKNKGDKKEAFFPYSHYAMDVTCPKADQTSDVVYNDGNITVEDAQQILNYYTEFDVAEKENPAWNNKEVIGLDITVKEQLHADPNALDPYATDYRGLDRSVLN